MWTFLLLHFMFYRKFIITCTNGWVYHELRYGYKKYKNIDTYSCLLLMCRQSLDLLLHRQQLLRKITPKKSHFFYQYFTISSIFALEYQLLEILTQEYIDGILKYGFLVLYFQVLINGAHHLHKNTEYIQIGLRYFAVFIQLEGSNG